MRPKSIFNLYAKHGWENDGNIMLLKICLRIYARLKVHGIDATHAHGVGRDLSMNIFRFRTILNQCKCGWC